MSERTKVPVFLDKFMEVSERVRIELPSGLSYLVGNDLANYHSLHDGPLTPVLDNIYDFEWVDALDSRVLIEEWLSAEYQNGNRFLPFAANGAGDVYCIIELASGEKGIGLVWHDVQESSIEFESFGDFIFWLIINSFANIEGDHEDFTEAMHRDAENLRPVISADQHRMLTFLLNNPVQRRPFKSGPKAPVEQVNSLISQEECDNLLSTVMLKEPIDFVTVARWDCGEQEPEGGDDDA